MTKPRTYADYVVSIAESLFDEIRDYSYSVDYDSHLDVVAYRATVMDKKNKKKHGFRYKFSCELLRSAGPDRGAWTTVLFHLFEAKQKLVIAMKESMGDSITITHRKIDAGDLPVVQYADELEERVCRLKG